MAEQNTYKVTFEGTGREWTLRPVPKHLFLMSGQLPQGLSSKAIEAMSAGDTESLEKEVSSTMTEKQIYDSAMFARDAVKYACVDPKIVAALEPQNEGEISAFEVSEEEFAFLVRTVVSGGQSPTAAKFRRKSR